MEEPKQETVYHVFGTTERGPSHVKVSDTHNMPEAEITNDIFNVNITDSGDSPGELFISIHGRHLKKQIIMFRMVVESMKAVTPKWWHWKLEEE